MKLLDRSTPAFMCEACGGEFADEDVCGIVITIIPEVSSSVEILADTSSPQHICRYCTNKLGKTLRKYEHKEVGVVEASFNVFKEMLAEPGTLTCEELRVDSPTEVTALKEKGDEWTK